MAKKLDDIQPEHARHLGSFRSDPINWKRVDPFVLGAKTRGEIRRLSKLLLINYRTLNRRRAELGLPGWKRGREKAVRAKVVRRITLDGRHWDELACRHRVETWADANESERICWECTSAKQARERK